MMNRSRALEVAVSVAVSLVWLGTAYAEGAAPAKLADGDAVRGHKLFLSDGCFMCHGTVGQGSVGPRLAPNPFPPAALAAYIRNPSGEMPPYTSKVVSDADVRDIHAYLATIPKPPALAGIPELQR